MGNVVIYTQTGCQYCKRAMDDYTAKGIRFREINTSEDMEAKRLVKEKYGAGRVPVIVEDGKVVSTGYNGGG